MRVLRIVLVVCLIPFITGQTTTHQTAAGWVYPIGCCADKDCRVVPPSAVEATHDGWLVKNTGEIVGYREWRRQDSPDGQYHLCQGPDPERPDRTYCLFVPPFSM